MSVVATVYNAGKKKLMEAVFNLTTDTIKMAILGSGYTPNFDTHDFFDDLTNEVVSAGYTAGGATLANKSITIDTVNDLAYFDADDVSLSGTTITARYLAIYKSTGTASTSPLLFLIDLGVDRVTVSEIFYVQWSALGIFKLT